MSGFFNTVKNIVTYKPKDDETFELLEENTEGTERKSEKEVGNLATKSVNGKDKREKGSREKKDPLPVDEWNRKKNEERADNVLANGETPDGKITTSLTVNMEIMKQNFKYPKNQDIQIREFRIGKKLKASIVFINGMVDKATLNRDILPRLMCEEIAHELDENCPIDYIMQDVLAINSLAKENKIDNIIKQVLNGDTALFIDYCAECLLIETRGYEKRSVEKPVTENVVMGSQEGFTENMRTNITLVRRIIKNNNFVTELIHIGKTNHLNCAILYIDGVANPQIIEEVKRRIESINADFVIGDGMLSQFIEDSPFMLLPQILHTERPDRVASFLTEGQVVVMSEGTPFAEAVPVTFYHLFHTSEDTFLRWQYGTFLRLVRVLGIAVSTALPALYVAVTLFHQEMIPTELLSSIARSKEQVPFPTLVEILMLEFAFELIREGGIRVPGVIGQTLGIIGALILGQAAVAAGLVSPILIIVVAVTGLGSFAIPNYSLALGLRILRFVYIFLASILGFYGVSLAFFFTGCMACNMKSFGVPFFSPVAPKTKTGSDMVIRKPIWKQKQRPDYFNPPNRKRQGEDSRGWKKKDEEGSSQ